jgi:hypothetical protein
MNVRLIVALLSLALGWASFPEGPAQAPSVFLPLHETEARLSWGGSYHRVEGFTAAGRVKLHYLKLDPQLLRPTIAIPSEGIGRLSPLKQLVRATGALAGINANFFDPATGLPVGFLLKDGLVLSTPYGRRATLAIGFFGRLHFLNPEISLLLRTPYGSIPIEAVNRPAYRDALIAYTRYAGPRGSWEDARVLVIREGRILWIGAGRSVDSLPIEEDDHLLVATGRAKARIEDLLPADPAWLDYQMRPERHLIRDALQAGPRLLQEGEISLASEGFELEFTNKPAARSALALTHDGQLILLLATQEEGSVGMSLIELAEYLRGLGAVEALALDGGSSGSLVFHDGVDLKTLGGRRKIPVGLVFLPR